MKKNFWLIACLCFIAAVIYIFNTPTAVAGPVFVAAAPVALIIKLAITLIAAATVACAIIICRRAKAQLDMNTAE